MKNVYKIFIIFFIILDCLNPVFAQQFKNLATQPIKSYVVEDYNTTPGKQELDLFGIETRRERVSPGILSPDGTKAVYSEIYYYPQSMQTSTKLLYFNTGYSENNLDNPQFTFTNAEAERIINPETKLNKSEPVLDSGMKNFDENIFRTLTVVDWSYNGKKLLIKEKVGEHYGGIWATNLWVYDFDVKKIKRLDEIRKAIIYYWRTKHDLALYSYRWDIIPLGWDYQYPDQIIVNAYGYNYDEKVFLGCWSIDYNGRRTKLLSLTDEHRKVGKYGKVLKAQ